MGRNNVVISFLKENNVDYNIKPNTESVLFPCIDCNSTAEMCIITTNWICMGCNQEGNLLALLKYFKEGNSLTTKLFDPEKEKKDIKYIIKELLKKYPDSKESLTSIEYKIVQLVQYFEKKPS